MSLAHLSKPKFPKIITCLFINHLIKTPQFSIFQTTQTHQISNLSNNPQQIHYRKQISLAKLLQRYGFQSSQLHDFLTKNKSLLDSNILDLEKSLKILLIAFKLHQNVVVSLICSCPSVLELGFLRKWEVGIGLWGPLGGFSGCVRSVLEFSRRFQIDPDGFFKCAEVLKGLGFSDGTVCRVFDEYPGVVMINVKEIMKRVEFLRGLGIDMNVVDRMYFSCPRVLRFGVEKRLMPLLNEFLELGFGFSLVKEEIVREPRILGFELGELRVCLELIKKLKCRMAIKEEIFSEGEFRAGFSVKMRVDCLCRYGLTRRDAMSVLKREPRLILYDIDDVEKKIEFLLERMDFSVDHLVEAPEYLGMHFEKQIVPRYNVIEYLRSKGALGFEVGLRDIVKPSRLRFYNFYVKPYPECEEMYGRFSEYIETKPKHPTGLWKVFKPPKYSESKEDVKNVKLFMETLV